jgi:CheY-like chemotaxis protein
VTSAESGSASGGFYGTSVRLARNPLGIIALSFVLVYAIAALTTVTFDGWTSAERLPIIWFIVVYPVLVLTIFTWLVAKHSNSLYAPGDFRDDQAFLEANRRNATTATFLAVDRVTKAAKAEQPDEREIATAVSDALASARRAYAAPRTHRQRRILWVDDRPQNNLLPQRAFESAGVEVIRTLNTADALSQLSHERFDAVISDMERAEGPREGYVLLDEMRERGDRTPFVFFTSSKAPEHQRETREHGGQGLTNDAYELFDLVMAELEHGPR